MAKKTEWHDLWEGPSGWSDKMYITKIHKNQCCGCGMVHIWKSGKDENGLWKRMKEDKRGTAAARRQWSDIKKLAFTLFSVVD
tara:strand:- start:570 stop:818 length:249 start_codon:yes stop_codon:yes gene_type:complete